MVRMFVDHQNIKVKLIPQKIYQYIPLSNMIPKEVVTNFHVFGSGVLDGVVGYFDCVFITAQNMYFIKNNPNVLIVCLVQRNLAQQLPTEMYFPLTRWIGQHSFVSLDVPLNNDLPRNWQVRRWTCYLVPCNLHCPNMKSPKYQRPHPRIPKP